MYLICHIYVVPPGIMLLALSRRHGNQGLVTVGYYLGPRTGSLYDMVCVCVCMCVQSYVAQVGDCGSDGMCHIPHALHTPARNYKERLCIKANSLGLTSTCVQSWTEVLRFELSELPLLAGRVA